MMNEGETERVSCFCCNGELVVETPHNRLSTYPVYNGLIFRASGNFGTGLFDPLVTDRDERLEILICDTCIRKHSDKITRIFDVIHRTDVETESFSESLKNGKDLKQGAGF